MATGIVEAAMVCLAMNVYFEAGGEPVEGQMAVAHVTINRAHKLDKMCDTVFAPAQFSWTGADGKVHTGMNPEILAKSLKVARAAWKEARHGIDPTNGALYYHTKALMGKVKWSVGQEIVHEVGQHVFFKTALVVIKHRKS